MQDQIKSYLIPFNHIIYDLFVLTNKIEDEFQIDLKIEHENDSIYNYRFCGTISNLIEHDKNWKKFEFKEILDLIEFNHKEKKFELSFEKDYATLRLAYNLNGVENKLSMKFEKKKRIPDEILRKKDSIIQDCDITTLIQNLTREIKKLYPIKYQLLDVTYGMTHDSLKKRNEYPFELELKYSGNFEFIINFLINLHCEVDGHYFVAYLDYENISTCESGNIILYSCRYYNHGYENRRTLEPLKENVIKPLGKGNYKMNLILENNYGDSGFELSYLRLFLKHK